MRSRTCRIAATLLGLCTLVLLSCKHVPLSEHPRAKQTHSFTNLPVGLTRDIQKLWHHSPEGSELIPLSFLEAMIDIETGKPMIEGLERFGFLPDDTSPHGLPIGFGVQADNWNIVQILGVGVNCSACHTAEFQYQGRAFRIDGAPNLVDFEAFARAMQKSAHHTLLHPLEAFKFLRRVILYHHNAAKDGEMLEVSQETKEFLETFDADHSVANFDARERHLSDAIGRAFSDTASEHHDFDPDHALTSLKAVPGGDVRAGEWHKHRGLAGLFHALNRFEHFFEARWKLLNRVLWAFDNETVAGPGRADPFNSIRDILFAENFRVPMNSPVSIPHLFGLDRYQWIHWDGNTTTKLGRNIAQAVALGADYDPKSGKSSVNVKALHDLETAARLMKAPAWPEDILGPIDRSLAERGKTLFTAECARCHSSEAIYSVQEIGTDPLRTANFGAMLGTTPFPEALGKLVATMTKAALDLAEAPPADRARLEPESGVWRSTGGYIARTLDGIWSTPPFLHTGAVPTLYDLLLPASRRPAKFVISGRDFDPKKVGLQLTPDAVGWTFDSSQPGNGNQGHEFGTSLSDPDRWALIEYLKTL